MKRVYVVLTSNFDLFGQYPNGIADMYTSERKAEKEKERLNELHESDGGVFMVELFYIKT